MLPFISRGEFTTSNNKFSYTWIDDIVYDVELPIGLYEISDIKSYFKFVMSQNNHVMTNTETGSTIYFIDFVVSNTAYSIDILTYTVPASLPTGYTSSITFIGTERTLELHFLLVSMRFLVMPKILPLMRVHLY